MQLSMSSMQQSIITMQQEVYSINLRVEQNQLDFRECLKFHHPYAYGRGCLSFLYSCFYFFKHLVYIVLLLFNS